MSDLLKGLTDQVEGFAEKAKDLAGDALEKAKDVAEDAIDTAKEKLEDLTK